MICALTLGWSLDQNQFIIDHRNEVQQHLSCDTEDQSEYVATVAIRLKKRV